MIIAAAFALGGIGFIVWSLGWPSTLLRHTPVLRLAPYQQRAILLAPQDYASIIVNEREAVQQFTSSIQSCADASRNLVGTELAALLVVALTMPAGMAVPSPGACGRLARRIFLRGRRRGLDMRAGFQASGPGAGPDPRDSLWSRWSARRHAWAAVVSGAAGVVTASAGGWYARLAGSALLAHAGTDRAWKNGLEPERMVEAVARAFAEVRWVACSAFLLAAPLLGFELFSLYLLYRLADRLGAGEAPALAHEKAISRGRRRGSRLLLTSAAVTAGTAVLLAALILADWRLEPLRHRRALRRLEEVVGPIAPWRFQQGRASLDERNTTRRLVSAAASIRLEGEESPRLTAQVNASTPGRPLSDPDLVRALLASNAVAVGLAENRSAKGASDDEPSIDGFHQLLLTRLLYVHGAAAALDHDERRYGAAMRALTQQAEMLEPEPDFELQTLGAIAEKYQLKLLHLLVERGERLPSETAALLARPDLRRCYVEAMALHGLGIEDGLAATLDGADRREERASQPLTRGGATVRVLRGFAPRFLGRVGREIVAYHAYASGLDWTRRFVEAYPRPFAQLRREIDLDPAKLSWLGALEYMTSPEAWYEHPANLRALAQARELARLALRLIHAERRGTVCATARGDEIEPAGRIEVLAQPDGGCLLRAADRLDFIRTFNPKYPPPLEWIVPPAPNPALSGP